MRTIEFPVGEAYDGKKLYSFLKTHCKLSSKLIRSLKRTERGLCVNGAHARIDILHGIKYRFVFAIQNIKFAFLSKFYHFLYF